MLSILVQRSVQVPLESVMAPVFVAPEVRIIGCALAVMVTHAHVRPGNGHGAVIGVGIDDSSRVIGRDAKVTDSVQSVLQRKNSVSAIER